MAELGRQQDMVVFFICLDRLTKSSLSEWGRFVLLDRLFKRYLREEDLDEAIFSMTIAKQRFQLTTVSRVDLINLGLNEDHTLLDINETNLAEIFDEYFNTFFKCVESYRGGKKVFGYYYNPVKVSRIDLPGFTEDHARPEKAYDDLVGTPFWFPKIADGDPTC